MACAAAQVKERGVGLRLEPRARRATSREPAPHDAKYGPRVTRFYTALNDGIGDARLLLGRASPMGRVET